MRFQVPQFIEHETKVVGPFTFRQFVFLAVPGAVAFFFYFTASFQVFVMAAAALMLAGFGLGFLKVGGKSLPEIFFNILSFSMGPKTYIWKGGKRKGGADAMQSYSQTQQEQAIAGQVKLSKEGNLKNLTTEIQTKK